MTNFRQQWDSRIIQINGAIDSMPGNLDSTVPGLTRAKLKRFFQRFSILFGRLDKTGAKNPQFLVLPGVGLPDFIISHVDGALQQMANGAAAFTQNILPNYVDWQERLERAVGQDSAALAQLSISTAKDLAAAVVQSDELLEKSIQAARYIEELVNTANAQQAALQQAQQSTKSDVDLIAKNRKTAEDLLSADGRKATSLESISKRLKEKENQIIDIKNSVDLSVISINDMMKNAEDDVKKIDKLLESVSNSALEAERVLGVSAQAGLARSYLSESKKLQTRSYIFTGLLYISAIVIFIIAACYVLPTLEHAISSNSASDSSKIFITMLRASILAPLIYILYFTTRQISAAETLRMDYAEKAAASLAYSGYRDEMSVDTSLLERLRGSLLLKFAEHPERLLRKDGARETVTVEAPGFKATSTTGPAKEPSPEAE